MASPNPIGSLRGPGNAIPGTLTINVNQYPLVFRYHISLSYFNFCLVYFSLPLPPVSRSCVLTAKYTRSETRSAVAVSNTSDDQRMQHTSVLHDSLGPRAPRRQLLLRVRVSVLIQRRSRKIFCSCQAPKGLSEQVFIIVVSWFQFAIPGFDLRTRGSFVLIQR